MIKRQVSTKVLALAKKYPAIAVTGPRQSGKTTMIKELFGTHRYFSMENPDTRLLANEDPRGFLGSVGDNIILDEVQQTPHLFSYLQERLDNSKKNGAVILSGSQSFLLNHQISQTLAGRVVGIKLLPFSYHELKAANLAKMSLNKYLFKGGYPRLYKERIAPPDFYPHYVDTYLQRDVRQQRNIGNLAAFMRFLKLCAGRIGNVVNISSLANDADIAVNTAKLWLSQLEASYVVFFVQPYSKNVNRRLIKMPKMYFFDTGLACSLLDITDEKELDSFYLRGNLFENMVFAELMKNRYNQGLSSPFYFLRDSNGNEIDCVVEKSATEIFIEIKMSGTLSANHLKGILSFQKNSEKPRNSYVIYTGRQELKFNGTEFVNWENLDSLKF